MSTENWSQNWAWCLSWLRLCPLELASKWPFVSASKQVQKRLEKEFTFSFIQDSGTSILISTQKDDFVGPMTSPGFRTWLKGIVKGLSIQWKGHVKWPVLDTSDQLHPLKVPAYYVLQTKLQLLSTTSFLQQFPGESNNMEAYQLTLSGTHGPGWRNSVVAWVNPSSNLPMTTTACWYSDVGSMPQALNAIITTVSTKNMNLSEGQKNLVCCWCSQLGYTSYKHIPSLMRSGTLAHSEGARHLHTVACKLT